MESAVTCTGSSAFLHPAPAPSLRACLQAAFIQAVRQLHQLGALDDYLKPVQQSGLWAAETQEASTFTDEGGKLLKLYPRREATYYSRAPEDRL